MWGALQLAAQMRNAGQTGSIVTLLCDSGERYLETYYNPQWVAANIGELAPWQSALAELLGQ
jgi:cysteine synthase A